MSITTVILDLDETIYPSSTGLWDLIGERITRFIQERLQIPFEEIRPLQYHYYNTYGTTLRGLVLNHGISAHDYLDYVHDVPVEKFIKPDPALRGLLEDIPFKKFIFTNSDKKHSRRVLTHLGLLDLISLIVDVQDIEPFCKPQIEAFEIALRLIGNPSPSECLFIDDNLRNIEAASSMGMKVVHINEKGQPSLLFPTIKQLNQLPDAFPLPKKNNGG